MTAVDAEATPGGARWGGRLFVLLLAALLLYGSIRSAEGFRWGTSELLLVGAVDFLLVAGLHQAARWARGLHLVFGLLGSLLLAGFVCASLRLDPGWLAPRHQLLVAMSLLVLAHQLLLGPDRRPAAGDPPGREPRPRRRRGLALAYLLLLAGGALAIAGYQAHPRARWQLLHHQRVVGLPLFALLSSSIEAEEEALRSAGGGMVDAIDVRPSVNVPAIAATAADARPDHVVFVLVDTWRADTLAAWGAEPDLMPRLNALAERGTALTDVHANASWTRASCATFFTGLLPEESGATSFADELPDAWTTLPEVFQAAGYSTAAFVTNWIQVGIETGFGQGFDHFAELVDVAAVGERLSDGSAHIREVYARAAEVNGEVFGWLDGPDAPSGEHPVFLYVHYLDPHSPYLAGVESDAPLDPRARKRSAYRQEVRYVDEHLARLVEGLSSRLEGGVAFVITSDHGEEFWEHGAWGHGHSLYSEQLWVPALVLQSGATEGRVVDAPLELRDLFDLSVRLAAPGPLDVAAWAGARRRAQRYASQYLEQAIDAPLPDRRRTVMRRVDAGGKTLIWSAYGATEEVYDREAGRHEARNVLGTDDEHDAELRAGMAGSLRFWAKAEAVVRTREELEFLRMLGYAGGDAQPPPEARVPEPERGGGVVE